MKFYAIQSKNWIMINVGVSVKNYMIGVLIDDYIICDCMFIWLWWLYVES